MDGPICFANCFLTPLRTSVVATLRYAPSLPLPLRFRKISDTRIPRLHVLASCAYIASMYRWPISLFGKTPARSLGIVVAPDQASATTKVIDYFSIESTQRFRVVAMQLDKVEQKARSKKRADNDS